jgi:hypothetical protein
MPLHSRDRVYTGRHVTVDFQLDARGIRKIATGWALRRACLLVVTTQALPYAVSISPRSRRDRGEDRDHPHYQDSFQVESVVTGAGGDESIGRPPMRRVGARLVNIARHAAVVEFGKRGQRGHHILRRTLEHLDTGPS